MGPLRTIAIALGAAIFVAAAASPVPASTPAPSPSVTPAASATPQASPSPSLASLVLIDRRPAPVASSSPGQPKVLSIIYTSAFCSTFVEHFNNATNGVTGNDRHLDSVDSTIHQIDADWDRRDGAMRVYDDRVRLIADVGAMIKSIPQTQSEVNDLIAQAHAATDPQRKAALQDAASQLQKAVDKQRTVAYDLTSVIHVLEDKHTSEDTAETAINQMTLPGYTEHGISLLDDPVDQPGVDSVSHPNPKVSPTPTAGDLEDVLQWGRQRWIIASSESEAAISADKLVRICDGEVMPSPPAIPTH